MSADRDRCLYETYDPLPTPAWIGSPAQHVLELKAFFDETGNGIHAYRALQWIRLHRLPMPSWVVDWLFRSADEALKQFRNSRNTSANEQAKAIGKAHGFGTRGKGGRFGQAALVHKDEAMFWGVYDLVEPRLTAGQSRFVRGQKLEAAYHAVSARWACERSTVIEACGRHLRRLLLAMQGLDGELRQSPSNMEAYLDAQLRSLNTELENRKTAP